MCDTDPVRSDFDRVIIERPRWGSRRPNQKTRARVSSVSDEVASRVPMRIADKEQTDLLGPLRRYLQSNLGRPWNKVHAEIRAVADVRSLRGYHLLQHVAWFVEKNGVLRDGREVLVLSRWGCRPVRGFFVHPKSGLLRFAK